MFDYFRNYSMPIKFTVKIVRLKVYYNHCQSDDLDLHARSQVCLKCVSTCNISENILSHCMTVDLCTVYMLISMTLTTFKKARPF